MISTPVENTLWATAEETIRNTVSGHDFKTYFEAMECLGREGDTVVLQADSLMAEVWVTTNYLDLLVRNLTNAAGRSLTVRVVALGNRGVFGAGARAARAYSRVRILAPCARHQGREHL